MMRMNAPLQTNVLPRRAGGHYVPFTGYKLDSVWLTVGTVLVTIVAFIFTLWGSGWHLAPPLDDTFIHFQYASQLANGHPFQYNTGDPPSSGDSSFIYPFILAPSFLFGLNGQKPLIYADLLNFVAHVAAILLLYSLALKLGGRPLALLSAIFLLLDGRLNYIFLSGMETGLYASALVAFFWVWARDVERGRFIWLALMGALVALLRTEGHVLVSLVCMLTLGYLWRGNRRLGLRYLWLLLPVLAGLIPYAANLAMTGEWQFNTAASKSIWYLPYSPLYEKLSLTAGWAISALKDTYLGLEVGRSPFPLMAAFVAVLGVGVALNGRRYRFLHILLVTTFLGGLALALLLPPIQFNRYYMPYDFIFMLYFAVGLAYIARLAGRAIYAFGDDAIARSGNGSGVSRWPFVWAGVAATVLLLPQFVGYFFALGDSTRDIYYQQMTFSDWVRQNTPAAARIGVNDTGAHKYMTDRYIVDLIGLTNNRLRGAYFSGWGTVFDTLAAMPEKERPGYLLIHPNVFLNGINESIAQSFLTPVYQIKVQNIIITAGGTEVLYKVNWEQALQDPEPTYLLRMGEQPLDRLNVGDLGDEKRHAYKIAGREPSITEPKSTLTTSSYGKKTFSLSESGRGHSGWEEFTVKSVAGKPLTLVSRSRLNTDGDQQVMVLANGKQAGIWKEHNERGGSWQEYEYTIPAEFVTGMQTTVRLDTTFDPGGPGFTSYRYWVYAP